MLVYRDWCNDLLVLSDMGGSIAWGVVSRDTWKMYMMLAFEIKPTTQLSFDLESIGLRWGLPICVQA